MRNLAKLFPRLFRGWPAYGCGRDVVSYAPVVYIQELDESGLDVPPVDIGELTDHIEAERFLTIADVGFL